MTRTEILISKLKLKKAKLEERKNRFIVWQEQIDNSKITRESIEKAQMYWHKQRRLEDRIYFIDDKLFSLEKSKLTYGIKDLINNVLIGESKWKTEQKTKLRF